MSDTPFISRSEWAEIVAEFVSAVTVEVRPEEVWNSYRTGTVREYRLHYLYKGESLIEADPIFRSMLSWSGRKRRDVEAELEGAIPALTSLLLNNFMSALDGVYRSGDLISRVMELRGGSRAGE